SSGWATSQMIPRTASIVLAGGEPCIGDAGGRSFIAMKSPLSSRLPPLLAESHREKILAARPHPALLQDVGFDFEVVVLAAGFQHLEEVGQDLREKLLVRRGPGVELPGAAVNAAGTGANQALEGAADGIACKLVSLDRSVGMDDERGEIPK